MGQPPSVEVRSCCETPPTNSNPTYSVLTDFISYVILIHMSMTEKVETVWFTTKGQVVIPLRLRKQFDIEDGTKAVVQATPEGILLKPMTAALIRRGRGILKRTPGGKPLTEEWAEHKKRERALEERHAG
jgi:AbrB family looped-hinge helix DNA binding protein